MRYFRFFYIRLEDPVTYIGINQGTYASAKYPTDLEIECLIREKDENVGSETLIKFTGIVEVEERDFKRIEL